MNSKQFTQLNSYAIAAGCFLYLNQDVSAQVVYTDIEPDIILNDGFQVAAIDLDDNGVSDFFFHHNSFLYYNSSWLSFRNMQNILVGPDEIGNAIAGISNYYTTGYGEFTRYYPFALSNSNLISGSRTWQSIETQIMALRVFSDEGDIVGSGGYCYWFNFEIPETQNKFLGVRFKDDVGLNYYGWIRCDVLDEGRTLVIKDYAYEAEPEYPIITGDTSHYVSVLENTFDANVYSFGNKIYINLDKLPQELNLTVNDISGKMVYADKIDSRNSELELHVVKGVYVVQLISEEKKYSKKVFIN